MNEVFADLHVHIGRSEKGKPIKITAARSLNFANIAKECADRKGINIVGIIDCAGKIDRIIADNKPAIKPIHCRQIRKFPDYRVFKNAVPDFGIQFFSVFWRLLLMFFFFLFCYHFFILFSSFFLFILPVSKRISKILKAADKHILDFPGFSIFLP